MLIFILTLIMLILSFKFAISYYNYECSLYSKISNKRFLEVIRDSGTNGEYLTVKQLENLNIYKKILVNVYLNKRNNTTTEIDIIMICTKGIFVFESKNYIGWIFGTDTNRSWTQTLPNGEKHSFYNPILQNNAHINQLDKTLRLFDEDTYKSYIVFGDKCRLKKIDYQMTQNLAVVKRSNLLKQFCKFKYPDIMPEKAVDNCYEILSNYCNVSENIKERHIKQIKEKQSVKNTQI